MKQSHHFDGLFFAFSPGKDAVLSNIKDIILHEDYLKTQEFITRT